jgi:hypothetical protein
MAQTFADLTAAFEAADNAWQAELVNTFGVHASDLRYTSHGRGENGTALRAAYEARRVASDAWTRAKQFV